VLLTHRFDVDVPADEVFGLLVDLDRVTPCLAGATLGAERADGWREGRLNVRFGPMRFSYAGVLNLSEIDRAERRAVLSGKATESEGSGTVTADITMSVSATSATASRVDLLSQVEITGRAAQMGAGFIEDVAETTLEDFSSALRAALRGPVRTGVGSSRSAGAPGGAATQARSLRAGPLLRRALRRRVRRWVAAAQARLRSSVGMREGRPAGVPRPEAEYDLVIAGTGSGALAAAILAHDAGLRVAIFEKADRVGGGTAFSGGVVWAPANHIMRRKGLDDSVENAMTYLAHASGARGDRAIQQAYVENVAAVIEQVEAWTGIAWVIWTGQPDYYPALPGACLNGRAILPHPAAATDVLEPAEAVLADLALVRTTPHMDFVPGFQMSDRLPRDSWLAGRSIIGGLWKAVLERGIEYHVSTPVVSLLRHEDAVVGVEVEPQGQKRRSVYAGAVLLNTGGFDWNETMAQRYLPGPKAQPQTPPSNTGDGHVMAMSAGAGTALMDKAIWHPSIQIPGDNLDEGPPLYRMFNMELSKPHTIVVNRTGRRFGTEAAYYALADMWAHIDTLSRDYPNVPSWFVCDSQYREKYGLPGVGTDDEVPAWISSSDTLVGLARALGVDDDGLAEEVSRYNDESEAGVDPRFHRGTNAYERYWGDREYDGPNPTMGPLTKPPFYGYPIHLAHAGTRGGVVTDPTGRVLRADGSAIPGLYASGNTAANLLFGEGYASGSAVGSSLVFGTLAAKDVVARASAHAGAVDQKDER
jgi:succinate dehydrogenase/fumarate reductase flavoprotein subunit/carbon monoxide dehydrogenase subunit G